LLLKSDVGFCFAADVLVSLSNTSLALQRVRLNGASPSYGPASGNTSISIQVRLAQQVLASAQQAASNQQTSSTPKLTWSAVLKLMGFSLQGAGFQEGLRCVYVNGTAVPPRWLGFNATIQNSGAAGVLTDSSRTHVAVPAETGTP
jgi:hypothetical protein